MTPTIGRIVLYRLSKGHCPLLVTGVAQSEGPDGYGGGTTISGYAFPDQEHALMDIAVSALFVPLAREGDEVGQWSWPPRV